MLRAASWGSAAPTKAFMRSSAATSSSRSTTQIPPRSLTAPQTAFASVVGRKTDAGTAIISTLSARSTTLRSKCSGAVRSKYPTCRADLRKSAGLPRRSSPPSTRSCAPRLIAVSLPQACARAATPRGGSMRIWRTFFSVYLKSLPEPTAPTTLRSGGSFASCCPRTLTPMPQFTATRGADCAPS